MCRHGDQRIANGQAGASGPRGTRTSAKPVCGLLNAHSMIQPGGAGIGLVVGRLNPRLAGVIGPRADQRSLEHAFNPLGARFSLVLPDGG
jgi:hypothetical protein